jgi:hypothetical protein
MRENNQQPKLISVEEVVKALEEIDEQFSWYDEQRGLEKYTVSVEWLEGLRSEIIELKETLRSLPAVPQTHVIASDTLLERAAKEPLDVDLSDSGDEFVDGFLRGQVNALEHVQELESLAAVPQLEPRLTRTQLDEMILDLCDHSGMRPGGERYWAYRDGAKALRDVILAAAPPEPALEPRLTWFEREVADDDLPSWVADGSWLIEQHDDEFLIGNQEEFFTFSWSLDGAKAKVERIYAAILAAAPLPQPETPEQ